MPDSLTHTLQTLGRQARDASRAMLRAGGAGKSRALLAMAQGLREGRDALLAANARDLDAARARNLAALLAAITPRAVDRSMRPDWIAVSRRAMIGPPSINQVGRVVSIRATNASVVSSGAIVIVPPVIKNGPKQQPIFRLCTIGCGMNNTSSD